MIQDFISPPPRPQHEGGVAVNNPYVHAKQDGALVLRLYALTPLASWHQFFIYAVIFG